MSYVPRVKEYVLTLGIQNSIIGRWNNIREPHIDKIICDRCRKIINLGEKVVRKARNGRGKSSKRYHKKCAKEMNLI